jgi:hypothetical protein
MEAAKLKYNSHDFRTKSMWTTNTVSNFFRDESADGKIISE